MPKMLGIDFGLKRTGIAITDDLGILAVPHTFVMSIQLMSYLIETIPKLKIEVLVLGYPLRLDGKDTHISDNVRLLKEALEKQFPSIPVYLQDERFTSSQAMEAIHQIGKKKQHKNKGLVDKISAAIILQEYLKSTEK